MEGLRETGVICAAELRRALRSGRMVVLLLLYLLFTFTSGLFVRGCASGIKAQAAAQLSALEEAGEDREAAEKALAEATEKGRREFIRQFFSEDEALVEALLATPLVLLVVFKLGLFFLPFYVALMGFDQLSGEMGQKSIRYLAVRARRSSLLFGKLLAQGAILATLMLLVDTGLCIFGFSSQETLGAGELSRTLGKLWASALVFSLPYLALTALCSVLSRQSIMSLLANFLGLFLVWLVGFLGDPPRLGGTPWFTPWPYLKYASVWYYRTNLLHPDLSQAAIAVAAHLGFALFFLGAAQVLLQRRDL